MDHLPRLCTAKQMQIMDQHAIETLDIPGLLLMENAARSVADGVETHFLQQHPHASIVICCGKGNNGGDGFAIARLLKNRGYSVSVIEAGRCKSKDAQKNQDLWKHFGNAHTWPSEAALHDLQAADVIIDAIFGTGLEREITGAYFDWIETINQNQQAFTVAVDVPSGIQADHGQILGVAVRCDMSFNFQCGKQGCFQYPGKEYSGNIQTPDISIPPHWDESEPATYLLTSEYLQPLLPKRPSSSHKGTYGHLMTIGGFPGMAGAPWMASHAALKVGAGLVTLGVPLALQDTFLNQCPEVMTLSSSEEPNPSVLGQTSLELFQQEALTRDAVVLGCGMGQQSSEFCKDFVASLPNPLLIDADGLNNLTPKELLTRQAPTILTPHPKELERLSGIPLKTIQATRIQTVRQLSQKWNVVLVLKGAYSVIGMPDGRIFINPTGNPGMSTAGSGDVLSGVIGGLLVQLNEPEVATLLGVYLHGLAADLWASQNHESSLTAVDLIDTLSLALKTL